MYKMSQTDSLYAEPILTAAKGEYCPECDCQKVYWIGDDTSEFYCPNCDDTYSS
jgi:formamidopyrimidine-DNA glycosylase